MKLYNRILEYLIYTAILTFAYYPVLIPWMIFIGHMGIDKVEQYLWQGYIIDLIVSYPIAKLIIRLNPTIKYVSGIDLLLLQKNIRGVLRCRWDNFWDDLVAV